jgi:hypothetical protein
VRLKISLVGVLNLVLILGVFGCAATATKSELPPAKAFTVPENKKSISYRYFVKTLLRHDRGVRIDWDENSSQRIRDSLVQSNRYSDVVEYSQGLVDIREPNSVEMEKRVAEIVFPIQTDLFLDIQAEGKDYGPHAYMYWGLVHILSLGLIPIYTNADISWSTVLYDRDGVEISRGSIGDRSSIWAWSPLFFFNGFHMFRNMNDVAAPAERNALFHVLSNSETQRKFSK